jgi:acyl-homoserine lactone acylase PvdQ
MVYLGPTATNTYYTRTNEKLQTFKQRVEKVFVRAGTGVFQEDIHIFIQGDKGTHRTQI